MPKTTEFGKEIAKKLIDMEKSQSWLIGQVKERTGLYFDDSYLYKVRTGQSSNPKVVCAIKEILSIE